MSQSKLTSKVMYGAAARAGTPDGRMSALARGYSTILGIGGGGLALLVAGAPEVVPALPLTAVGGVLTMVPSFFLTSSLPPQPVKNAATVITTTKPHRFNIRLSPLCSSNHTAAK